MTGLDQHEMVQALNLTRAGRLAEATERIQRTIGLPSMRSPIQSPVPSSSPPPVAQSASLEGTR
jgi:hypothetical protein